jgi:uncharacterized protein
VAYGVDETSLGKFERLFSGQKLSLLEAYVLGVLYPTVYFHKATRGAENIYVELLARAVTLVRDGSVKLPG